MAQDSSRAGSYDGLATEKLSLEALIHRNHKLTALLDVVTAMTYERDFDKLLDLILREATRVVDAERGSLFIADHAKNELWSKIAQGLGGETKILRMPIGRGIAGLVARSGEVLNIPDAYKDTRFNQEFDKKTGFTTHSILCVPMLGRKNEVVGVLQALNKQNGEPFDEEDERLLVAFGANAAAAIENANLREDIERLFEGFVEASVTAIEARDPTTSGHSFRVANLSCTMLDLVPRSDGPYRNLVITKEHLKEMRYAALLHDFGKVGVREHVLVKADKLYPHELEMLEERFEQARRAAEVRMLESKVAVLESLPRPEAEERIRQIDDEWRIRDQQYLSMLSFIKQCNKPSVLESGGFEKLREIAEHSFPDVTGRTRSLLTEAELKNLSIARGSLNEAERREIESHVVHTYNFLRRIPWTRDLANVAEYARGHHEKLDGTGYPSGAPAYSIPIQTRVMTIADIYDALTAADRPYKPAMPHARALMILEDEAKRGKLDQDLLRMFIEADVPSIAERHGEALKTQGMPAVRRAESTAHASGEHAAHGHRHGPGTE